MHTALDEVVLFHDQQCTISACVGHDARAELAALRQRVAELERERDAARSGHDYAVAEQAKSTAYITELLQERGQSAFDLQEYKLNIKLMQKHNIKQQERIAELEAANDNQADWLRHWAGLWTHINNRLSGNDYDLMPTSANFDAMSDSLIGRVNELEAAQAIVTPNNCRHCQRAAEKMREAAAEKSDENVLTDSEYNSGIRWAQDCPQNIAADIRALPLPACDGCNPLKPDIEHDEVKQECGDCKNFSKCVVLFGCQSTDTECDWSPSRFDAIR